MSFAAEANPQSTSGSKNEKKEKSATSLAALLGVAKRPPPMKPTSETTPQRTVMTKPWSSVVREHLWTSDEIPTTPSGLPFALPCQAETAAEGLKAKPLGEAGLPRKSTADRIGEKRGPTLGEAAAVLRGKALSDASRATGRVGTFLEQTRGDSPSRRPNYGAKKPQSAEGRDTGRRAAVSTAIGARAVPPASCGIFAGSSDFLSSRAQTIWEPFPKPGEAAQDQEGSPISDPGSKCSKSPVTVQQNYPDVTSVLPPQASSVNDMSSNVDEDLKYGGTKNESTPYVPTAHSYDRAEGSGEPPRHIKKYPSHNLNTQVAVAIWKYQQNRQTLSAAQSGRSDRKRAPQGNPEHGVVTPAASSQSAQGGNARRQQSGSERRQKSPSRGTKRGVLSQRHLNVHPPAGNLQRCSVMNGRTEARIGSTFSSGIARKDGSCSREAGWASAVGPAQNVVSEGDWRIRSSLAGPGGATPLEHELSRVGNRTEARRTYNDALP